MQGRHFNIPIQKNKYILSYCAFLPLKNRYQMRADYEYIHMMRENIQTYQRFLYDTKRAASSYKKLYEYKFLYFFQFESPRSFPPLSSIYITLTATLSWPLSPLSSPPSPLRLHLHDALRVLDDAAYFVWQAVLYYLY